MYLFVFLYEVSGIKEVYIRHRDACAVFFNQVEEKYFWNGAKPFTASVLLLVLWQGITGFDKH